MREIHRTYSLIIVACSIVLLLHSFLLLLIYYYTITIPENLGSFPTDLSFDLPPFLSEYPPPWPEEPFKNEQPATIPLENKISSTTQEEKVDIPSLSSLEASPPLQSEVPLQEKTSLASSVLPLPKPRRSIQERQTAWHKKGRSVHSLSNTSSEQVSFHNPFKSALDVQNTILKRTPPSRILKNNKKNGGLSRAYNAEEQALATIKAAYMQRFNRRLAEQTKFFHHYHYLKDKMPAHTLHLAIEWNKKGKIINFTLIKAGPNKEINDIIKEFFMNCTLPSIPPQLPETFNHFFTVYVEQTPQGFATFTMRPSTAL